MRKSLQAQSGILFLVLLTGLTRDLNSWTLSTVSTSFSISNRCLIVCHKGKVGLPFLVAKAKAPWFKDCVFIQHPTLIYHFAHRNTDGNQMKMVHGKGIPSIYSAGIRSQHKAVGMPRRTSHISGLSKWTVWWEIQDSKTWRAPCDACVAGTHRREPDPR